jgi:hypothetical protein
MSENTIGWQLPTASPGSFGQALEVSPRGEALRHIGELGARLMAEGRCNDGGPQPAEVAFDVRWASAPSPGCRAAKANSR